MTYIRLNNHFSVILFWSHVSVAANGFQKFAISLLKTKFLPNFNTTAPLCKSNSSDPRNFNILPHHSYNHFPFYWWGGVIGQFSLVFALPKCSIKAYYVLKANISLFSHDSRKYCLLWNNSVHWPQVLYFKQKHEDMVGKDALTDNMVQKGLLNVNAIGNSWTLLPSW